MADFNPNIDKITERELVPDIYERTTIGKPLESLDGITGAPKTIFFAKSTPLSEIDSKLIMSLPESISLNISRIHMCTIDINTFSIHYNVTFPIPEDSDGNNIEIAAAYLENTLTNVKSLLQQIQVEDDYVVCPITFDTPFIQSDKLKIYYYFT